MTLLVQRIAITFDDGSVGIMSFILNPRLSDEAQLPGWDPLTLTREASDEAIQYEIDKSEWGERTAVDWRRIEEEDVPTDRTYRNAWTDNGGFIHHDMVKAREIHKNFLREARMPLLLAADVAYIRADETGDAAGKVEIAAEKQVLRDVTDDPAIAAAETVEELKATWPWT